MRAESNICSECGSQMSPGDGTRSPIVDCPNPDCPTQVRGRIERWCSRDAMDITGGDAMLVAQLVQIGLVRDVADLYRLKLDELLQLERMGKQSAQEFIDAIQSSKSRELWRLLIGLGIPRVEIGAAQALARTFKNVDQLRGASFEQIRVVESVGNEPARSVMDWFGDSDNRKLIGRLQKAGVNF